MTDRMQTQSIIRRASDSDAGAVESLLHSLALPTDGATAHLSHFLVADAEGEIVGSIGLEPYADSALLRSAAVAESWQGRGLGRALTERIIGEATISGVDTLYLLTTTAARYFATFGFVRIERDEVPGLVRGSVEFTSACPASATVMMLSLRDD